MRFAARSSACFRWKIIGGVEGKGGGGGLDELKVKKTFKLACVFVRVRTAIADSHTETQKCARFLV